MRARVLPVLLAALAACKADFAPQYLVSDLRVLSIRAEVVGSPSPSTADPDLGDTLRLEALVADPRGAPDLSVEWFACLPVTGTTVPPCLDPSALRDPGRVTTLPGVIPLGAGPSIDVAVPTTLQPAVDAAVARAVAHPEFACSLYAELPVLAIARAGGATRSAVKTVRIAPQRSLQGTPLAGAYHPNRNPSIATVRVAADAASCAGGVPLDPGAALERRAQTLCAAATAPSVETFDQCDPSGARFPLSEDLSWQWYTTGGSFDTGGGGFDVGNATDAEIQFTPPAGAFTLWLILRDGRGGEDWFRRDLP
jgi:hypothetical protein